MVRNWEGLESLAWSFDRQQLGSFRGIPHELLTRGNGAIAGYRQVTNTVHLLGQGFLAQQGAVALHQHQAWLHGIKVHLHSAFGLGADTTVGDHQRFAVRQPGDFVRANAMGAELAGAHQALVFETVDPQHATARVSGIVFGGVQPLTVLVQHGMTIEMPVRRRYHRLQQLPVAQVDQVAFSPWAASHEQGDGLLRVIDDGMATLGHLGAEHLGAVQAIAHGVMLAIGVVACRQQQGLAAFFAQKTPAAQGEGTEYNATEFQGLASQHDQSPSLALKPN